MIENKQNFTTKTQLLIGESGDMKVITSIYKIEDGKQIHHKTIENFICDRNDYVQTIVKEKWGYSEHNFDNNGFFQQFKFDVITEHPRKEKIGQLQPLDIRGDDAYYTESSRCIFHGKKYSENEFSLLVKNKFRNLK